MSAKIWEELQASIREIRPDLANSFNQCRDREAIVNFMNANFPLKGLVDEDKESWEHQSLTRIPEMMKEHGNRVEWRLKHEI